MKGKAKNFECVVCKRQQYNDKKCYGCGGKVFEDLNKPPVQPPKKKEGSYTMDKQELVQQAFGAINNFKRHRALMDIKTYHDKMFHELQMFKMIDQLELALRAINKDMRESEDVGA